MITVTNAFRSWLKASTNMKLPPDASVNRIIHEVINDLNSLVDFDKDAIQCLSKVCKETIDAIIADYASNITAEVEVPGANASSISVQCLLVASKAARYYESIDRVMTTGNMHHMNILIYFKVEHEAYEAMKKEDGPNIPKISEKDGDRKIIRWAPLLLDYMEHHYCAKGPLRYVLRDDPTVKPEQENLLTTLQPWVFKASRVFIMVKVVASWKIIARPPHSGPVFKNDNATVFQKIAEAARGTSCEFTIKAFSR